MATMFAQPVWITTLSASMSRVASDWSVLPFDMAREQYAIAVNVGLVERSMLKSAKFGRGLYALEKLMLGPLARKY